MLRSSRACVALTGYFALAVLTGCSEPVNAPTSYKQWNAKDGTFAIEYPEGWNADGGGKSGIQWAEFKKGSCVVKVDTDTSTSIVADIAGSATAALDGGEPIDPELAKELAPAEKAHNWVKENKPAYLDEFSNYKEEESQIVKAPLGEGRKSAFTASKGMGQKIKGYRATFSTNDRGIIIFAYCPEKNWATLQPAYDKMLDSLALGTPEN
jgi:hypothetical protein